MIPEDQDVPIRREILLAVLDEGRQVVRVRHVALAEVAFEPPKAPGLDLVDLVHGAGNDVVLPGPAAAGLHDHVHLVGDGGLHHLAEVAGAHAVLTFKVRATHVDHDGDGVLAVALGDDPLGPGLPHHGGGGDHGSLGNDGSRGDHRGLGIDGSFRDHGRIGIVRRVGGLGELVRLGVVGYVAAGEGAAALAQHAQHRHHGDDDEQDAAILLGQHQQQGQKPQLSGGGPFPVPVLPGALIEAARASGPRAYGTGGYLLPLLHVGGAGTDFFTVTGWPFVFHGSNRSFSCHDSI